MPPKPTRESAWQHLKRLALSGAVTIAAKLYKEMLQVRHTTQRTDATTLPAPTQQCTTDDVL